MFLFDLSASDRCVLGHKCAEVKMIQPLPTFHGGQLDLRKAGAVLGMGVAWHMITDTMQSTMQQRTERYC